MLEDEDLIPYKLPFVKESVPFTIATFERIGAALCISILDITD